MNVSSILQGKGGTVHTVRETASLNEAVRILGEHNIGAVVVLDVEGACCGILSERDIVRQLAGTESPGDHLSRQVCECMTRNVHVCGPEDSVETLLSIMTERRIRHLPVVEGGALKGIVSIGDVVKRKIDSAEQEAETLRSYISAG